MTEQELTRLVGKYRANVYRLALCYTKNHADAEDVTQEAFLKLYLSGTDFLIDEEAKAWLFRVAANRCKDLLKSHWYKFSEPLTDDLRAPELDEESGELLALMSKLPEKTRTVLYMYYYEEYSVKEIAGILGEKETVVTSQLWRGRKRMKSMLTEEDNGERGELHDGI